MTRTIPRRYKASLVAMALGYALIIWVFLWSDKRDREAPILHRLTLPLMVFDIQCPNRPDVSVEGVETYYAMLMGARVVMNAQSVVVYQYPKDCTVVGRLKTGV